MYERNERQGPCILFWLETAKKDRLYKECLLVRQKAVHCLIKKIGQQHNSWLLSLPYFLRISIYLESQRNREVE